MSGPVVVAGATGFVGRHLVQHLLAGGREVCCGTRDPERARRADPSRTWVGLDVERADGLVEALTGADALVYLVHQMGHGDPATLHAREVEAARRVLRAAERAGVRRIVYLGAPRPAGAPSHHLQARLDTGAELRSGAVSTLELRASMIVGAGSESWLMVRDLALRLPVMLLPSWLATRTQPIALADVVHALASAIDDPLEGSAAFDLPGPEVLSARQILERVAAVRGFRPVMIPVPVLTPRLSSHWIRLVTRADFGIARQLVDGMGSDLVAEGVGYWARMDRPPTPFDEAVRTALSEETDVPPAGQRFERWVQRVGRSA